MKRDWIRLSARIRGARDHSDGGVPAGTSFIIPECCGLARANPSVATPKGVQEMPTWPGSVPRVWTRAYKGKRGGTLCFTCHGPTGKGIPGLGPDLTDGQWLYGDGGFAFLQKI